MSDDRAWLARLKPGDQVAMQGGGYTRAWDVLTVTRRTATQILCSTPSGVVYRFRSDYGWRVGKGALGQIEPLTDRIRGARRRANSLALVRSTDWGSLSDEVLASVAALVRPPRAPSPGEGGKRP